MTFLEWTITWFFADHLASKQGQTDDLERLREEINHLRSEIDYIKNRDDDWKE